MFDTLRLVWHPIYMSTENQGTAIVDTDKVQGLHVIREYRAHKLAEHKIDNMAWLVQDGFKVVTTSAGWSADLSKGA